MRNAAKGLLTPVGWRHDDETLLDVTLPKCAHEKDPCEWVSSSIPTVSIDKGKTTLGYGVNKDEFKDEPDAFRRKTAEGKVGKEELDKLLPLTSELKGTVADSKGDPTHVNVTVRSEAKKTDGAYDLRYVISVGEKGAPLLLHDKGKESPGAGAISFVWESAESKQFRTLLMKQEQQLTAKHKPLVIELSGKDVGFQNKLLILTHDRKKIASVSAPAYVPVP